MAITLPERSPILRSVHLRLQSLRMALGGLWTVSHVVVSLEDGLYDALPLLDCGVHLSKWKLYSPKSPTLGRKALTLATWVLSLRRTSGNTPR